MEVPVAQLLTGNVKWSIKHGLRQRQRQRAAIELVRRLRQSTSCSSRWYHRSSFLTSSQCPSSSCCWDKDRWRIDCTHQQSRLWAMKTSSRAVQARSYDKKKEAMRARPLTSAETRSRLESFHPRRLSPAADFSATSNPLQENDDRQEKDGACSSSSLVKTDEEDLADDDDLSRRWQEWKAHWYQQLQSIPNWISIARIIATPVLSYWIVTDQPICAVVGCTVAALSDFLDGWIAKQCKMETVLGTYLDPLADKILINVLSIATWYTGTLPTPIVAIWLSKDIALMVATYEYVVNASYPTNNQGNGLAHNHDSVHDDDKKPPQRGGGGGGPAVFFLSNRRRMELLEKLDPLTVTWKVRPTFTSKVNTALQFAVLGMAIIHPLFNLDPHLGYLSWTTAGTTIMAVGSYMGYTGFTETHEQGQQRPQQHHDDQSNTHDSNVSLDKDKISQFNQRKRRILFPRSPIVLEKVDNTRHPGKLR